MIDSSSHDLERLIHLIMSSPYTVAFTGAGISAESGIPTFRGKGGLWEKYSPEELATPEAFARDPEKVWKWYAWRMRKAWSARPNPAHAVLARLEERGMLASVITQNVDGLHQAAGSRRVIELHGSMRRVRCSRCRYRGVLERPPEDQELPLKCPECGGLLRPDVVWFGEPLPEEEWSRAYREASKARLMLVVGTSALVYPAAMLPEVTLRSGGKIVVVNPEPTPLDDRAVLVFREKAGVLFGKLGEKMGLL